MTRTTVDFREWLGTRGHSPLHLVNLVEVEIEVEVSAPVVLFRETNLRSGRATSSRKTKNTKPNEGHDHREMGNKRTMSDGTADWRVISKSLATVENIYFAHTCAHKGANSVASMVLEIWTRHESVQVHIRIRSGSNALNNVAEWQESKTAYTGARLRKMFSYHRHGT